MDNSTIIIRFTSPTFEIFFEILTWLIFCVSTLLFVSLIWAIIAKSPKEMGVYKWYMVVNFACTYILEVVVGFFHPRFIFPIPGLVFGK